VYSLQPNLALSLDPKLAQPHPRPNPHHNQQTRHNQRPMLQMRDAQTIRRPARRTHGGQPQRRDGIPCAAMILVHGLCPVDAAVQLRHPVLREPNEQLDVHERVEGEAQARMRRRKVLVARPGLVELDDDEAGRERGGADEVRERVDERAGAFLRGRVCRLQGERGLEGEQEAGCVEQLCARMLSGGAAHKRCVCAGW
jgi:hypothetical protein